MLKNKTTTKSAIFLVFIALASLSGEESQKFICTLIIRESLPSFTQLVALKVSSCRIPLVISSSFLFVFFF